MAAGAAPSPHPAAPPAPSTPPPPHRVAVQVPQVTQHALDLPRRHGLFGEFRAHPYVGLSGLEGGGRVGTRWHTVWRRHW